MHRIKKPARLQVLFLQEASNNNESPVKKNARQGHRAYQRFLLDYAISI